MPRPCKKRKIVGNPDSIFFKPVGIKMKELKKIQLSLEEFEAIRLIDFEQKEQETAAKQMEISQPTLSRILKSARNKISDAIINSKAIEILTS